MQRLSISGNTPYQINLDTVDQEGATIDHVQTHLASRGAAARIAAAVIAGDSLTLASLRLPIGDYELVPHAAEAQRRANPLQFFGPLAV